jgi:hypothetical protein
MCHQFIDNREPGIIISSVLFLLSKTFLPAISVMFFCCTICESSVIIHSKNIYYEKDHQ